MIDIPGIYVGRFKDNPNQSTMLMKNGDTPTYTDDNWANVESTGTIWRYSSETGEWVDTGLEEILVEEVAGTKQIIAEGTVPWKLQGLNVYGKSTQVTTTGAQLFDASTASDDTWLIPGSGVVESAFTFWTSDYIPVTNGSAYTIGKKGSSRGAFYDSLKTYVQDIPQGASMAGTWTAPSDGYIRLSGDANQVPKENFMLNAGSTALPWEPYTGGKASPSPDYPQEIVTAGADGSIDISVSDGADQSQQLSIQTLNGLPGIPVDSGGNFTDETGQQWVCDEVDFERGVYVQRVKVKELNPDDSWAHTKTVLNGNNNFQILLYNADTATYSIPCFCNILPFKNIIWDDNIQNLPKIYANTREITVSFPPNSEYSSLEAFKQLLTDVKSVIYYALVTPIETLLSAEELAAYAALMSYDGSTIISTDEDVSGISAKVVTDVISKNAWFDPYAELARYYKALAGFESFDNLPIPHSRESSLVRKLLDSSYELGFSVNENSSRNERYLWDLINGTSTMLTNIPKSDTEKFLHVMIGGTVEEYPVVDTELDYWMDKCVNYMRSNGSIGG